MKLTDAKISVLWDGDIQGSKPCGGISRYSECILEKLGSLENLRILAVCPKGAPAFRVEAPNLRQISVHNMKVVDQFRLKRFQGDIFHSVHYKTSPTPVPATIQTAYDFIDRRFSAFYCNREDFADHQKRLIEQADGVVAISESTRNDVLEFTAKTADQVVVAYPTLSSVFQQKIVLESERQALRNKLTGGKPFLLWVGPRAGYKNFGVFLRAFCAVAHEMDLHLLLVGRNQPRLNSTEEALVLSSRNSGRIHIRRQVTDESLRLLYASARALVQSSICEGFGIPLIESLASGGSLLVSDIPVFREVVGHHAYFADPYNVDAWVHGIQMSEETCDMPSRRQKIKAEMEERFHPSRSADTVFRLYQNLRQRQR